MLAILHNPYFQNAIDQGDKIGQGLPTSCLGFDDAVAAIADGLDAEFLDGGEFVDVVGRQSGEEVGV